MTPAETRALLMPIFSYFFQGSAGWISRLGKVKSLFMVPLIPLLHGKAAVGKKKTAGIVTRHELYQY